MKSSQSTIKLFATLLIVFLYTSVGSFAQTGSLKVEPSTLVNRQSLPRLNVSLPLQGGCSLGATL